MADSKGKSSWNWIENLLEKVPIPVPIISIIICIIIYIGFGVFYNSIDFLKYDWQYDFWTRIMALTVGISLGYLIAGIPYLLDKARNIFCQLDILGGEPKGDLYRRVRNYFMKFHLFCIFAIAVIVPFYAIDFIRPKPIPLICSPEGYLCSIEKIFFQYYLMDQTIIGLEYDIYRQLLHLIFLLLLSYILWIIFNINRALNGVSNNFNNFYNFSLTEHVISIDLRLRSMRSDLLKVSYIYFVGISIAIFAYLSPIRLYEMTLLFILLLIGVSLFLVGLKAISSILTARVRWELELINRRSQELSKRLFYPQLGEDYNKKNEEINYISNILNELQKQREGLLAVNTKGYDFHTLGSFAATFLIPILSMIAKIQPELNSLINSSDSLKNNPLMNQTSINTTILWEILQKII